MDTLFGVCVRYLLLPDPGGDLLGHLHRGPHPRAPLPLPARRPHTAAPRARCQAQLQMIIFCVMTWFDDKNIFVTTAQETQK